MKKLMTVLAALLLVIASNVQAAITDVPGSHFIVNGADTLTTNAFYYEGKLYDSSSATILTSGSVFYLYANDNSTANVSGPGPYSGGAVGYLNLYDNSTANITGGHVNYLSLYDNNTATISTRNLVGYLYAGGNSTVTTAPGGAAFLYAESNGTITISGSAAGVQFYGNLSLAADGKTILGDGNAESGEYDEYGDYLWSFQIPTGANNGRIAFAEAIPSDTQPPLADMTTVSPDLVAVGTPITVTAIIDDTNFGGSKIASAEYRIAGPSSPGTWTSLDAADGTFDEVVEQVSKSTTAPTVAGVYTIYVRGYDVVNSDPSNEDSALLVVYDPSAGFVTGGGWIISPAGASASYPAAVGKANFGFVSKYLKGANTPTGNTEFQFKAGDLNFKSTSYEWLVVAGARAQYKGSGTINGQGDYQFILTAIDGQVSGGGGVDKFRIKISDAGGVVYDNQPGAGDGAAPSTAIGGGSIVIHK